MSQKLKNLLESLKNICHCKILRLTGRLNYPFEILPKTKFKLKIDFNELVSGGIIYVLRRSELPQSETFHIFNDGSFLLNEDALDLKRIPYLSLNIMGARFKAKHSKFIATNAGADSWTGGNVYLSKYLENYSIDDTKGSIFINANELHDITLPYNLSSNPQLHKEIEKFKASFGSNILSNKPPGDIELLGRIRFVHDPVALNYWHVVLEIKNFKDDPLEKAKNATDRKFVEVIFNDWIKVNSYPQLPNYEKIKKNLFVA
ncbi:hypothetical protein IVB69_09945 [Flavobacterium sp. J49]|uniref:hypothetical protein n=1 Tax=Flavobacterium sp. J49 TaxID=2718534 RepID=UPI001593B3EE|nr:hypothetical protein [Flavobacterium sp. J49]MBF6641799.1 hypothetical protein [Flavobacterium sp. J49]NIC03046.1 hypothetical protein [Flavobacterium sp. J49]